ncbi:MAG: DUF362 domain-containing protein [Candidatus Lokiarchaeota archaeon]|nr:DUF362 domain-containing protein [Candidatus Lokiarchaeota archaeon]
MSQPETDLNVAIAKADTPLHAYNEILTLLGEMEKFVSINDRIFVKINLNTPEGFPVNTSFALIKSLIKSCKKAGASEISLGSYSSKGVKIRNIDQLLKINEIVMPLGAQLLYLEEDSESELLDIIQNCDKFFVVNQVNVDPLFDCTLSMMNSAEINILNSQESTEHDLEGDFYKKEMVSKLLSIYKKRKPDLIINDLYHVMEGAGPYIYKDSNLIETQLMVGGTDPVAVDFVTLKLMGKNPLENPLIIGACERNIGNTDNINIIGVDLESSKVNINYCEKILEDITVHNCSIKTGSTCSGCYHIAYHLLNIMKTYMTKDLKYITRQSVLIGENPPEPDLNKNVILFGNCAIKSTENSSFRTIYTSKESIPLSDKIKSIFNKGKKPNKKLKTIEKPNKQVLNIPGCPPNLNSTIKLISNYYGKQQGPNLYLYYNLMETYASTSNKKAKKGGV